LNTYVVDPHILHVQPPANEEWDYVNPSYGFLRQCVVLTVSLYIAELFLYFGFCGMTYWLYYLPRNNNRAAWKYDGVQLRDEIFTSVWSMFIMAGMTAPIEVFVLNGHGKVYKNVSEYGVAYLFVSVALFLVFTDSLIYWIHRWLHHPLLYGPVHKLHHKYKETTPFSAFSFHPLDGWLQGVPYHIFVFIFPMHRWLYFFSLLAVSCWTMNIHDRFTFDLFGVNGAAHHTIHHTKFNYNYGQYFTFWDRVFRTFKDPYLYAPYKKDANAAPKKEN